MGQIGRGLLTIGGAIIGGMIGGPIGAAIGAQIGGAVGGMLFPIKLPPVYGPRMEDLNTTTAQLGGHVPWGYGTFAVPGTILWVDCVEEVVTTEEVGGKGGGTEQEVTTYTYFQSIAIGLVECTNERPIGGVSRIWENGELVFDIREQQPNESDESYEERLETSAEYLDKTNFVLYKGSTTQEPDPTMEAVFGEGNVPAFRELAYIVYPRRQLLDTQARRHPNWRFEIFMEGSFATSREGWIISSPVVGHYVQIIRAPDMYVAWNSPATSTSGMTDTIVCGGPNEENVSYAYAIAYKSTTLPAPTHAAELWKFILTFTPIDLPVVDEDAEDTPTLFTVEVTKELVGSILPSQVDSEWNHFVQFQCLILDEEDGNLLVNIDGDGDDIDTNSRFVKISTEDASIIWNIDDLNAATPWDNQYAHGAVNGKICMPQGIFDVIEIDTSAGVITNTYDFSGIASNLFAGFNIYNSGLDQMICVIIHASVNVVNVAARTIIPFTPLPDSIFDDFQTDKIVVDWENGYFYLEVFGSSATGGLRKVRISDNTEVSQASWDEIGFVPDNQIALYGFNLGNDGDVVVTYFIGLNTVAQIAIDTENWEIRSQRLSSGINDTFASAWLYSAPFGSPAIQATIPENQVSIADIIRDITEKSGLDPEDDIDVADLEEKYIIGYPISSNIPGRSMIEPLRTVGVFDAVESGLEIKFPVRGKDIITTIDEEDIGVVEMGQEHGAALTTDKTQNIDLPRRVRIKYIASSREYEPGEKLSPVMFVSGAKADNIIEMSIVLEDQMAAEVAEIVLADAWAGRWTQMMSLDISYSYLEPTDCIRVPVDGRSRRMRITEIDDSGLLIRRMKLVRDDSDSSVSNSIADSPILTPPTLIVASESTLVMLDLPALREEDDDAGFYAGVYRSNINRSWNGAAITRSIDGGSTYALIATVTNEAPVGEIITPPGVGNTYTWDNVNEIDVEMISDRTLESRDEASVIAGANAAAIGAHGRWEIVQFRNAVQVGDRLWRLSGLLRGRRGTEHNVGLTVTDDKFVLLSNNGIVRLPLQTSEIGQARLYRAATIGTLASDAEEVSFTGAGQALKPFSPVFIEAERDGSGNMTITWIRRGRLGEELRSGTDIPLSEETESYSIDIISGSPDTVLRTLTSSTQSVTYTAAQQVTDFGSVQSSVYVRVYQLSATVGRGIAGEAIV